MKIITDNTIYEKRLDEAFPRQAAKPPTDAEKKESLEVLGELCVSAEKKILKVTSHFGTVCTRTVGVLCVLAVSVAAASADEQEIEKLRAALRTAVMQQRDLQNQIANYQAADIAAKQEIERLKSANQKTIADLDLEKKANATLKGEVEKRDAVIVEAKAALEKWQKDFTQLIAALRKSEAETAKLTAKNTNLENLVEAQRRQNVEMYTTGMEILKRYENFWLGDALLAREPFVGNTKVKYQRLAQEGYDKIFAARVRDIDPEKVVVPPPAEMPEKPKAAESERKPRQKKTNEKKE